MKIQLIFQKVQYNQVLMNLVIKQFIQAVGKKVSGKEKGNKYGEMAAFMKGIGRIMQLADKED